MCGIAGFCDFNNNLMEKYEENLKVVKAMGSELARRGPDESGFFINEQVALSHRRLIVIDPKGGKQPMTRKDHKGNQYTIVYNGEIYNTKELRKNLEALGYSFETDSDTEVVLNSYIAYGEDCGNYLNGIFAFGIFDEINEKLFLCRDRFGIKPLFYTSVENRIFFSSKIKGIFKVPKVKPIMDQDGLCEIFGLGPARSPGIGVFKNIYEIRPGHIGVACKDGFKTMEYYRIRAKEHKEDYKETVQVVRDILFDAINRQLISDVPICTLLSGGLDSSVVSAVAAKKLREEGKVLDTYSFDYVDNSKYFKASKFQPDEDRPFVDIMVEYIKTNHTYLQCDYVELADCLYDAVIAKDLPGMTDVDSSMLYFTGIVRKKHTVCLSGECSDEIFGGYPWFRDPEAFNRNVFPWSKSLDFRKQVLNERLLKRLPLDEYVNKQYMDTINKVTYLDSDTKERRREREISYLNTAWFMTTLLDRKDRMTMYNSLEVRVPFADHRLVEYLFNTPWDYKYYNGEVKALLKSAAKDILPKEVLNRKKSPYPKTYNPKFENILKDRLKNILNSSDSSINAICNKDFILWLMESKSDYGKPWFGQLMATPQMYAYFIQMDYWIKKYNIVFETM